MSSTSDTRRVEDLWWYHTIELPGGVVTKGWFDTRRVTDKIGFPKDLTGLRCLDIGTFDGFWAFEMEKRGSSDVTAIDLLDHTQWDWPPSMLPEAVETMGRMKNAGVGFEVASEALESKVRRIEMTVYDLDPEVHGMFDFIYLGSLLLHLRDPIRVLDAVRRVCKGQVLSCDGIDIALTYLHPRQAVATFDGVGRPWWWRPNLAALGRMFESAGFELVTKPKSLFMPIGKGQAKPRPSRKWLQRGGIELVMEATRGDPHGAVLCRPKTQT